MATGNLVRTDSLEQCQDCAKRTRFRNSDGQPVCRSCAIKGRTCLRCDKPLPKASMTLKEGALCWPCSLHYHEPKPCPVCGQMSLHLARDNKLGFTEQPVCDQCRRKGHINCKVCGKHRRPAGTLEDGRVVCKSCLERGDKPFVCSVCGKEGKPHSKTVCQPCYWRKVADKRFRDSLAMFSRDWTKDAFQKFYSDLIQRQVSIKVATTSLERYFLFFAKLDASFSSPREITAESMIAAFGAEGMRRHSIPYGFLIKEKFVPALDREALEESSERRRQMLLVERAKDAWYGPVLERFWHQLEKIGERYSSRGWKGKKRRFVPRTITTDLRSASVFLVSLTEIQKVTSLQEVRQDHLDRFLADHEGYRTGISAFLRYLDRNEKLFRKISLEPVRRNLPEGVFLSRAKYHELLRAWLNPTDDTLKISLMCALMLLYAQSANKIVRLRLSDIAHGRDRLYRLTLGQTEVTLDIRLGDLFDRYLEKRHALATMEDDENNDYIFPGQAYGSHITESVISAHLKKHGVKATQIFSTAIFNAYMSGLRHPKVLVKAFGITSETAIKYLNLIDPQLIQTVNERVVAHA